MSFFQGYVRVLARRWQEQRQRIMDRLTARKDVSDAIFGILVILLDSAVEISEDDE